MSDDLIIDLAEWYTLAEIAAEHEIPKRSLARAAQRSGVQYREVYGRRLYHIDSVPEILAHYYPAGSEQRAEGCRRWGSMGGTQKKINAQARAASRGTSDDTAADS